MTLQLIHNEKAWIFTVARNLAMDWHRRNARSLKMTEFSHEGMEEIAMQPGSDPDADYLGQELLSALQELPAEQRIVAELRLWEGLSLREIAESQEIPLQTAASRFRYAISRLRLRLRTLYTEIK